MDGILDCLFGSASFVPHGYCLLWRPDLVALHAVSDVGIAAAYFAIPIGILVFAKRRDDMTGEAKQVAILFSAFIVLCGITHIGGLLTLWYPYYGLDGMAKAVTALVSILTAIAAWRLMPQLVAIPSPRQAALLNERLVEESSSRDGAYKELEVARRDLERQVAERTHELAEAKQLFEAATSDAQITIFSQDRELRYTWVHNPWLGMTDEAFLGETDETALPEMVREPIVAIKRRVLGSGEPETFEIEIPHNDLMSWFRIDVTPLRNESGLVDGILSTAIDISRGKRLEAMRADLSDRLSETVQRFNLALRSSDLIVSSQDEALCSVWSNTNDTQGGSLNASTETD